jgi:protein-S-isoprenylcysteine O-methyltransferase Ste14
MYIGAGFALIGAALVYGSMSLLSYTAILFPASHIFIIFYEEPTLRRTFGDDYEDYCRKVKRWLPSAQEKGDQNA